MKDTLINSWKKNEFNLNASEHLGKQLFLNLDHMKRKIFLRNIRESLAALVVIIVFIYFFFLANDPINQLIYSVGVAWALWVLYFLWEKEQNTTVRYDQNILDFLLKQKQYYLRQSKMLEHAGVWYVLPPFLLATVHVCHNEGVAELWSTYYLVVVVFSLVVYWINYQYAKKKMEPLVQEIDELIQEFKTTNDV